MIVAVSKGIDLSFYSTFYLQTNVKLI